MNKPHLSLGQIFNVTFGYLGVQIGFALQSTNVSRILSNLGAELSSLSFFWMVAPIMGLMVQPWVGAKSDRTWNCLGRRKPYILVGAIIASICMWIMPNVTSVIGYFPPLILSAVIFILMDGSFNITMQPFRALISDMVNENQSTQGYSIQCFLINIGAVVGSILPYVFTHIFKVPNYSIDGKIPDSVSVSFYFGGWVLLLSVFWTLLKTREYPPQKYCEYNSVDYSEWILYQSTIKGLKKRYSYWFHLFCKLPNLIWKLALIQFFSWCSFYIMWVYSTSAISQSIWCTSPLDGISESYQDAGNWTGVLFGVYSFVAALYSLILPKLTLKFGRNRVYGMSLILGGISFVSMMLFSTPNALFLPMIGIGIAWAVTLTIPYAILSDTISSDKIGAYMGLFNMTVAIPQIISGALGGWILRTLFHNHSMYMIVFGGVLMSLGAICVWLLDLTPKSSLNFNKHIVFNLDRCVVNHGKYKLCRIIELYDENRCCFNDITILKIVYYDLLINILDKFNECTEENSLITTSCLPSIAKETIEIMERNNLYIILDVVDKIDIQRLNMLGEQNYFQLEEQFMQEVDLFNEKRFSINMHCEKYILITRDIEVIERVKDKDWYYLEIKSSSKIDDANHILSEFNKLIIEDLTKLHCDSISMN